VTYNTHLTDIERKLQRNLDFVMNAKSGTALTEHLSACLLYFNVERLP